MPTIFNKMAEPGGRSQSLSYENPLNDCYYCGKFADEKLY